MQTSTQMALRGVLLQLCLMISFFNAVYVTAENEETWSCPTGWRTSTESDSIKCLWVSSSTANSYKSANDICKAFEANLVTVFSNEKHTAVKNILSEVNQESTWTGLKSFSGGNSRWETMNGWKEMTYGHVQNDYNNYRSFGSSCGIIQADQNERTFSKSSCDGFSRGYICEKLAVCVSGWYGPQCENQCHCHGQPCDPSDAKGKCLYGCESSWMGPACDKPREKAQMTYHCVHSTNEERRVTILIDLKGIDYRVLGAIDDDNKPVAWCNGTEILNGKTASSMTISISMEEDIVDEIGKTCAGKQSGNETYKWKISLKEWDGILMPMDEIFEVTCDFNNAETLSRKGDPVITEEVQATSVSQLDHTKESVTVKLIDTASKQKLFSAEVGSPVILQVHHDFTASDKVKSISPYNCEATSDDGAQQLRLLDSNGCQVEGSPVKPFTKSSQSNNSLETAWFPYFAFKGSSGVVFRCAFVFCFDNNCPVGCNPNGLLPEKGRYVRSTRKEARRYAEHHVRVSG